MESEMHFFSMPTALIPFSFYLFFLGIINLSRKTRMLTGRQDLVAVSLGVSGLLIVGPLQILLPQAGIIRFGIHVWYPLVVLYIFGVLWLLILSRPRIVLYNVDQADFARILSHLLEREGWTVLRNENVVQIHELGIQFEILPVVSMKNITLRSTESEQSNAGWRALHQSLERELTSHHPFRNPFGWVYLSSGLMVATASWLFLPPA